jgi:hypothetical protein
MNPQHRFAFALPLAVALLAGCGRGTDPLAPPGDSSPASEEQAVSDELARHPEIVEDGVSDSDEQTQIGGTSSAQTGLEAAIRPLFFWRRITGVERRFEFAFSDSDSTGRPTSAVVTVHKVLSGSFNIVAGDSTGEGEPTEGHVVRKRLRDHWVRRILLKRVPLENSDRLVWRIVASSGVRVTSQDADTRIESLRIQATDLDTTITNPLAFQWLRRIPRLDPGSEVTLTVTTRAPDDVVILYARGGRRPFHANGDNTYTGMWRVPLDRGIHHAGVNALARTTLFDDEAPYDSQAWILPYVVKPAELAEAL